MVKLRLLAEISLISLLKGLARVTPWEQLSHLAVPLSRLLWHSLPKRRAITIDNISKALQCSKSESEFWAKRVFHHVALTALEFLKMGSSLQDALSRIKLKGLEEVKAAWQKHGKLILLTGHMGNFELLGAKIAQELPLCVVARPQSSAAWRTIKSIRERAGMKVIDKFGSVREALRVLNCGGVLGILADQHAGDGAGTLIVSFFGRPASVFKTPALLAARTGAPIVFCYDVRLSNGTHEGIMLPPKFVRNDEVDEVTIWLCRELEKAIMKAPEQWWWLHDRWKVERQRRD